MHSVYSKNLETQKGFTLIELLVVISIVGLLSSLALTSFSIARYKARDAKRVQDLRTIATALEMYYQDNGSYPVPSADFYVSNQSDATNGWQILQTALAPYLSKLPVDPLNTGGPMWAGPTNYTYAYGLVGTDGSGRRYYNLVANLEDPANPLRCALKSYHWHYHYSGVLMCNNGGPGGWSYSLMGYQASTTIW
jgi:type II secretion system protein G